MADQVYIPRYQAALDFTPLSDRLDQPWFSTVAENIRDAAREVPLDRMFIETDSPFLAPVPHRGKRNEPAFVVEVARKIAEVRGLSPEQVGEQTSRNFFDFFKLHNSNPSRSV